MLTALDHVIVAVKDLAAARTDYQRLLGLVPSWNGVHPQAGTSNVLFRLENTYIELLAPAGEGPLADLLRHRLDASGEGMLGLAFATAALDACCATLAARGLEPGPIVEGHGIDSATGAERRWRRASLPPHLTRGIFLFPIEHTTPPGVLPMAAPAGDAAAAVHALDHAVVQTFDADAARKLFGDSLGIRLAVDKEFPEWGVRLMFFRIGGITLEVAGALAGSDSPSGMSQDGSLSGGDRLYGMSYRVRSIDRARERLAAAGVDVSEVRTGRRPQTRVCTVRSSTCSVPTLMIEFEDAGV